MKLLEKVEKIYLNNTNLAYALSEQVPDIGSVRETVFYLGCESYASLLLLRFQTLR